MGKSSGLILKTIEINDWFDIEKVLATINIEYAFDSLNHTFLSSVLKKILFGKYFITWSEILLKHQQLCVIYAETIQ